MSKTLYVFTCYPFKIRTQKQIIAWMERGETGASFQTKKSATKYARKNGCWIAEEPSDKSVFMDCPK